MSAAAVSVPTSVDATGVRDVTAELNAFFRAVPDGSQVDFADGGSYRVDGTVNITDRHGLVIVGHRSTLFTDLPGTLNRSQLVLTGGSDHTVQGLKIRGAHASAGVTGAYDITREGQHALMTVGVRSVCVHGCEFSNTYGDLTYFNARKIGPSGTPGNKLPTSDVWYYENNLHHSGRQGITLQGCQDVNVTRCTIRELRRSTFEFEPMTSANNGASRVHITENDIGLGRLGVIANHGSGPVNDIYFENNRVGRPLVISVEDESGARRSGWHVNGNVATGGYGGSPRGSCIEFTNVDGVEVTGNVQTMKAGHAMALVNVTGCTGVAVHGNVVTNGIELRSVTPSVP